MSPRAWRHRIEDILQAIRKIREYTRDLTSKDLANDDKTVDAVVRNFIVIGEAARHVPEEISTRHPSIPWRLMADMCNFAVHEYFGVSLTTIWECVQHDLPPLEPLLEDLLQKEVGE